MLESNLLMHVCRDHGFKNEGKFYRFLMDERHSGFTDPKETWHSLLPSLHDTPELEGEHLDRALSLKSDLTQKCPVEYLPPFLFDEHNCDWWDKARPIKWEDPEAVNKYDMVAVGAGAGGLVTAMGAKGVGAKVALIERSLMGGDCLNTGCVPSKAFLKSANQVY